MKNKIEKGRCMCIKEVEPLYHEGKIWQDCVLNRIYLYERQERNPSSKLTRYFYITRLEDGTLNECYNSEVFDEYFVKIK